MHWPCQNCVYVTFAWRNRTRDDESYLNDAVPFRLSDFTELLISDGRKSKAWVMPSSGIASRRDRDSQLLVLKAFGEGTISYSGDKLHIPPQECAEMLSKVSVNRQNCEVLNVCQRPRRLWQPAVPPSKGSQLHSGTESTLIRLCNNFSFQFSQSIPFTTIWSHPKRIWKITSSVFWV